MAKYSKAAQKSVESVMKRMEKGKLRSGKSTKKVTNPKQAIAIGLSEAREKGAKVPKKKTDSKKAVPVKTTKKAAIKKASPKKVVAKKKAAPAKKTAVKKKAPIRKAVSKKAATKKQEKIVLPVEQPGIDPNLPPVEEKSPAISPVINERTEDPIMVTDKKALAKAVTKYDPKHPMQLSSVRRSIRPSGKKPLWH